MNRFDFTKTETNLEIIIHSNASVFAKTILAFLALLSIMGLMGGISKVMQDQDLELVSLGIGLTVFIIVSIFMVRLFLWNSFGKEVLLLEQGQFSRYYDYKLFKSEVELVTYKKLKAKPFSGEEVSTKFEDIIDEDLMQANWKEGRLDLLLDEVSYVSPVNLAKADLLKLIQLISSFNKER